MKQNDSREKILKAAYERFGYYGFGKTTMVEIAGDCGMSAANIYRHFRGKNEIIAELAQEIFSSQEKKLAKIVVSQFSSFSEKMQVFFQEALVLTYQYNTEQPRMKEMVDFICQERFDLVRSHKENKREFIETILRQGCQAEEFSLDNPEEMSTFFKQATIMFHSPLFMNMCGLEELQYSCRNIVQLLLAAITVK